MKAVEKASSLSLLYVAPRKFCSNLRMVAHRSRPVYNHQVSPFFKKFNTFSEGAASTQRQRQRLIKAHLDLKRSDKTR